MDMFGMTPGEYSDFLKQHCWMYMVLWMMLPLPLIISARYFNMFCCGWIHVHAIVGTFMGVMTIVLGLFTFLACPWERWADGYHHLILAVIFFFLLGMILVGGALLRRFQKKGFVRERVLQCFKITHKLAGYAAIIIGFGLCHSGELLNSAFGYKSKNDRNAAYGYYYLTIGIIAVACEVVYRLVMAYVKYVEPKGQLVSYDFVEKEIAQGRKIIVFEDSVLDVQPYMHLHPGIDGLLSTFIGQEVGRFIYGGFPCCTNYPHNHSFEAMQLIESLRIAKLDNPSHERLFIPRNADAMDSRSASWTLIGKRYGSPSYTIFRFRCPSYKSSMVLRGVEHCGTYYALGSKYIGVRRNYCTCLTLSPASFEQHMLLLEKASNLEAFESRYPDIHHCYKNEIEIFIRNQHMLSTFVHSLEVPLLDAEEDAIAPLLNSPLHQFTIHGPFGPGIRLKGEEEGTVVALTTGIAAILFVDLAAYLLRMNAYELGRRSGKNYKIFENEVFDVLGSPNFKLILFASCPSQDCSIGREVFEGLAEFNRKHGFTNFEYHLRSRETMRAHWTPEFIQARIGDSRRISKTFVATGAAHEEPLINLFISCGVPRSMIAIL